MTRSLAILIFLLTAFAPPELSAEEPLRIGLILPLSGTAAAAGEACRNAVLLAQEDAPESLRQSVSFVFENDEMQSKLTLAAFHKLIAADAVDALVTVAAGPSHAIAPLAEARKIPLISLASVKAIAEDKKYVVLFWLTAEEQGRLAVEEAYARGYRKIARISATQEGAHLIRESFDRFNNGKLEIVLDEEVDPALQDFRGFLARAKRNPHDAIFVNLFFGQPGIFARQARELGLQSPLFNSVSFESPAEVKASQGALVGQWYVQAKDPTDSFVARFQSRFPGSPVLLAGNCYDVAGLFMNSVGHRDTADSLMRYLRSVRDYKGVMGVFSATPDNRYSLPGSIKVVTESGFRTLH